MSSFGKLWGARIGLGQFAAQREPPDEEAIALRFGGQQFIPLPSGALYWPAERALLVADLHLE